MPLSQSIMKFNLNSEHNRWSFKYWFDHGMRINCLDKGHDCFIIYTWDFEISGQIAKKWCGTLAEAEKIIDDQLVAFVVREPCARTTAP